MVQRQQLRVLIVGGGIGGLSAAVALRLHGHDVEVFEKSRLHTETGNAVYCAPNCTVALEHLGIHPGEIGGVACRGFRFLGSDCKLQAMKVYEEEERATWPAEWWLLTRAELHGALKQRALDPSAPGTPVRIHTASPVRAVDCDAGRLTLEDGTVTEAGDLVVGADGIYSRARASVLTTDTNHDNNNNNDDDDDDDDDDGSSKKVPLFGTGQNCYRCLIDATALRADPETAVFADAPGMAVQVAAPDRRIVLYPCSRGTVINLVAFVPSAEVQGVKRGLTGYDQTASKKQLMDHFKGFSPAVLRMLDMAPDDGVKLWDLVDMELQPTLIKGRAALIGDAAHPFMPYLGQGAAQAVEDGCALGVVLPLGTPPDEIPERLELWQRLRRDRAHKIVQDTRHRGRPADGSQGPPQTVEELNAAMQFCIQHDAWRNGEEGLRAWVEERTR